MNLKKLLVPFAAFSLMLTGCFGPNPGPSPVGPDWDSNTKNTMRQEFGMVIPYVTGLDISSTAFLPDYHVFRVSAYFDDLNEATDFVTSYSTKLMNADYVGAYSSIEDGYYGCYSHTSDKTIIVSGETINELLWVEFNVYTYGDDDYTIDLIAYLSGDFDAFPLDSLCEMLNVSDTYKSSIPTFTTSSDIGFRIKGYVPGDIYYYVVTVDTSGRGELFDSYTSALNSAGYNISKAPGEFKATGTKTIEGLGTIEVHYYDVANYFFGGITIVGA